MKILVLSPHTDDGQFGCGGTVARLVREGHEVYEFVFSFAEDATLGEEWRKALGTLGVKEAGYMNIPPRHFPAHRQEILERMYAMRDGWDMVFCPSSFDTHQDHEVIRQEAFRAFKNTTVYGYEIPWNAINFTSTGYFRLTDEDIVQKRESCGQFESQQHRPYSGKMYITNWANSTGVRIGAKYAEAFEVIREVR